MPSEPVATVVALQHFQRGILPSRAGVWMTLKSICGVQPRYVPLEVVLLTLSGILTARYGSFEEMSAFFPPRSSRCHRRV